MRCDVAETLFILPHIGVEQIDDAAADVQLPRVESYRAESDFHLASYRPAVVVRDDFQRKHRRVGGNIQLVLPAIGRDALFEIPLTVEERNADERQSKIACRFRVVAGENAKSARVGA